jgi:small subunit ribosomal protein S1
LVFGCLLERVVGFLWLTQVGTKVWVLITVAEESRGNIILSEVRAWAQRHLCIGTVHDGTVVQIFNFGARVQINGTDLSGLVHISNIARARVPSVATVFEVGEQVKVMAIKSPSPTKYAFSTADLESESGLMLRDKQRVFREAEEVAKKFRDLNPAHVESSSQEDNDDAAVAAVSSVKPVKPISNWEWLDFGDTGAGAGVL